jgi:hypothetical protein
MSHPNKRGETDSPPLEFRPLLLLFLYLISTLKALHLSRGIHDSVLASAEKGVALAAVFDLQHRSGRTSIEGIATGTVYRSIHILRVNILFHQAFSP